jgi:superfamily II DNA or RNA helicase
LYAGSIEALICIMLIKILKLTGLDMQLYTDQEKCVSALQRKYAEGRKAPVLVAPCGFGKTVVFAHIAKKVFDKGNSVIICAHRQELLQQICATLDKFDVSHGTITAGKSACNGNAVQVASVQTLARRLQNIKEPTLLIFDEAHHILANTWRKIISHFSGAKILGVTATPWRMNGEGLGAIFDCMVLGPTAEELMQSGRLAKPVYYAPPEAVELDDIRIVSGDFDKGEISARMDKPHVTGDAIKHYKNICPDVQAVAFCATVKHAENVAKDFRESGIPAESIDGGDAQRQQKIRDFADGKIKVLTSCELISEGFDLPAVGVAIMLRPTASLAVWVQQAGRALRAAPGKEKAIILDHVGNSLRHGFIECINEWSLDGIDVKKRKAAELMPKFRRCKNCFIVFPISKKVCPSCGGEPALSRKEIKKIEGELREMEARKIQISQIMERRKAQSLNDLVTLGRIRGYKNPHYWAQCVWNGRQRQKLAKEKYESR